MNENTKAFKTLLDEAGIEIYRTEDYFTGPDAYDNAAEFLLKSRNHEWTPDEITDDTIAAIKEEYGDWKDFTNSLPYTVIDEQDFTWGLIGNLSAEEISDYLEGWIENHLILDLLEELDDNDLVPEINGSSLDEFSMYADWVKYGEALACGNEEEQEFYKDHSFHFDTFSLLASDCSDVDLNQIATNMSEVVNSVKTRINQLADDFPTSKEDVDDRE